MGKMKKEEVEEDDDELDEDETVVVDGIEYQLNREDNIVIDPDDMEIMGIWDSENEGIDFESDEVRKKHEDRC